MTAKREGKRKPKKDERPKTKKQTLRDLDLEKGGENVKAGAMCRPTSVPW
jgi:hypothetical protein